MPTPTIKISFSQIGKLAGDVDKDFVQSSIMGVFGKIIEVIDEYNQVGVDLGHFGKFLCFDRSFSFEPLLKLKTSLSMKQNTHTKKTVRSLIE